ncbi:hypothetical protein [Clostridium celatum]|uniref:hypothetical protein n=1 Tax=Clostridium celatum TaxID=36834 RepID=UPI0028FF7B6A|nr:hypothetical protein [Clostridium celatum]MDU2266693.1 hypothetical protein [Clostridium celatum]MDU6297062.1 hypothetical protein [Clostridium celatum]
MARETFASKVTFFPMTESGRYGEAVKLQWCTNLKTKNNYKTGEQKADGTIEKVTTRLETVDIELGLSSQLPLSIEAKLTGAEYENGLKIVKSTTAPVVGALAYEIADDEGNPMRRRVLRNCTLSKDERSNESESEGEELKFTGKAIADSNGDVEFELDIKEIGENTANKSLWDSFFTAPIERPSVSKISEIKSE